MMWRAILASTALAASTLSGFAFAQDDTEDPNWQVCNETSFVLRVATAYRLRGRMVSRGWLRFRPGECTEVEAPAGEPRYIYAESSDAYQGGIREWKGGMPLCAEDQEFTSDPADECKLGDPNTRMFISLNPNDSVTTLAEPDDYGRRADVAGLQRLLKNNGYKISRIDGVSGRRTSRNISTFLKERKLPANLTVSKQIDALEEAARERLRTIGLTVCNRSSAQIWTAIGQQSEDNWESRGWWTIPVSGCVQLVQEPLKGSDMHIFARQENAKAGDADAADKTLRNISATATEFCITEARFTALGKEDCLANGYQAANFRPIEPEVESITINLTDADFVDISVTGLRR